ncbi:right-handed parallel beta-helix repeat-containing protein [Amnibacterium endophyticum]|uniref:Right-handed parallel beta-helix repeat-containing protein n=1 Tax=Amnibacterium endophyticum TaxID=2109337 RepID=A0ABW4LC03_9MICO
MRRLQALRATVLAGALSVALMGATLPATAASAASSAKTGTTYRVDCSQRKTGDGRSRPFNSLSAVNRHASFGPGDRILVRRGTTCTGRLQPRGSGTSARKIVLGAFGRGAKPILRGDGTPSNTATLTLKNVHDWTVQDLHVTNAGKASSTGAYRSAVLLLNDNVGTLPGMTVQRLTVDHVVSNLASKGADSREFGGIIAKTWGHLGGGYDGLKILHNQVTGVGRSGIVVANHTAEPRAWDDRVRIAYNAVRAVKGDSIILRGSRDSRIDHNLSVNGSNMFPCTRCGGISPDTANAGIWPAESQRTRIDHNEVYGEHALGGDGEGIDVDRSAVDTVVEYNYLHDNQGGGILFCGSLRTTARFNILQNNQRSAFAFIGSIPAKDTRIYNNTVYNSRKSGAKIVRYFNGAHGSKISFNNNVLINYGNRTYLWPTKRTTKANTLVGLHGAGRPTDSKTSWASPGLKHPGSGRTGFKTLSGYKPRHPSTFPKGVAIPKSVTRDFFGKKINPAKPPRGAAG